MARSYRRNFIETKDGLKKVFSHKVFSGWDYSIATQKAANLKSSSIYNELKNPAQIFDDDEDILTAIRNELLHEFNAPPAKTSCLVKFWTVAIQIIVNILTLLMLGGLGYLLWTLLDEDANNIRSNFTSPREDSADSNDSVDDAEDFGYNGIITAVVINAMMFIVPYIFTHITRVEDYKNARVTFYVSLFRTFMLEVLIIGILIVFWVLHAENGCWQTSLGQEIYRLVIFDFIFSIVFLVLSEIMRSLIYRAWKGVGSPEFDLARYTLQLTYNQTLFWVGLYFSPMLAVVVVLKMFITWYMISAVIINFCEPSLKSWRAAQTQTWFLIMSFVCLLLVMAVLGYVIISKSTSECGPFRHLEHVYDIIKLGILSMENGSTVWVILIFITKPGAVAIILLSMCMAVYYLSAKAQAQERTVGEYEKMLNNQRKDKEYLLKQISEVTKGQWQYNLQDNGMDSYRSSTGYSTNRRTRQDVGDSLDSMSSDLLLPSSSNSTFPLDDDNSNASVFDRYKLN